MTLNQILLIFFTLTGACIGSFLNVVVYRLPAGKSLSRPGSHCPSCSTPIRWFDNVPVLAWLWLGGRCRSCKARISFEYPFVEFLTAILFGGWFYVCYFSDLRQDFRLYGFGPTAVVFITYFVLWASLLACVLIDAKYYVIPLTLTWLIAGLAVVALPGIVAYQTWGLVDIASVPNDQMAATFGGFSASPKAFSDQIGMALGALVGLGAAVALLKAGIIPRSFDQAPLEAGPNEAPDEFLSHPHPRREVLKECIFLIFPVVGAALGSAYEVQPGQAPPWLHVLGGVVLGYLAGGAVVWATRIFGTLGFGKEAMGLGDVHLMAAVGAVTGWREPVLAFFIAPFFGLAWAVGSAGVSRILKREVRIIPYGPHLAVASLIVVVFREPLFERLSVLMGQG
jgi:leader peptidase (prepilin peptidase)/N-methyltransferase